MSGTKWVDVFLVHELDRSGGAQSIRDPQSYTLSEIFFASNSAFLELFDYGCLCHVSSAFELVLAQLAMMLQDWFVFQQNDFICSISIKLLFG